MANTHTSNDDETIVKNNIQRRFKSMFSGKYPHVAANQEQSTSVEGRQKRVALRMAGIFTLVSLAFFGFSLYNLFITQKGQAGLSDKAFIPITMLMVIFSLIGFRLIRHARPALGGWVLFSTNAILPSALAVIFIANIPVLVGGYLVISSLLFINLVLPKVSRFTAIVATAGAALAILAIELWNPSFRVYAGHTETFTSLLGV